MGVETVSRPAHTAEVLCLIMVSDRRRETALIDIIHQRKSREIFQVFGREQGGVERSPTGAPTRLQ